MSSTAVNKMGNLKYMVMDWKVQAIWDWAIALHNWLTSTHIPSILNIEADQEPRRQELRIDLMLSKTDFKTVVQTLGFEPEINLFTSRINTQTVGIVFVFIILI